MLFAFRARVHVRALMLMTGRALRRTLAFMTWAVLAWCQVLAPANAQGSPHRHLAPGFEAVSKDSAVVLIPVDVELFSVSAGGVLEPKADWTDAAQRFMSQAIHTRTAELGLKTQDLDGALADEHAELLSLHTAVARSISLHHGTSGGWALPTKEGRLDWSFGEVMRPLRERTGARYALFTWVRDSYASAERVATMILLAALRVGISPGGMQIGYASLVDLESGRVVWFNQLARTSGDLRDATKAAESINVLLTSFPAAK